MTMLLGDGGDLETYWRTFTELSELGDGVARRIYWGEARQRAEAPFVVCVEGDGSESHMHLGGLSGARVTVLHLYCYHTTPSLARLLAERMRLTLQGQRRTIGSTHLMWCRGGDVDSGVDPIQSGSDRKRFWTRVVLRLSHTEATAIGDL